MPKEITQLQKINSYLFPVRIYKTSSQYNRVIEVSLENGRLVLNSQNANYSFGSLLAIFKKAFNVFQIPLSDKKQVLMLGLGGGSVAKHITEINNKVQIDVVEIDPVMIEVATEYFGLSKYKNIHTVCADAEQYVTHCQKTYDLVLIDLFIDAEVPLFCMEHLFMQHIASLCKKNAQVVFNSSMSANIKMPIDNYRLLFKTVTTKKIFDNSVILLEEPV